jgi:hypothetical protein
MPAGTPVGNQALLFAGRHLGPDSALLLDELQLDSYSLAHEVRLPTPVWSRSRRAVLWTLNGISSVGWPSKA